MNEKHLALCASAEWADAVRRWIIPREVGAAGIEPATPRV
jgi:hypothetical protein